MTSFERKLDEFAEGKNLAYDDLGDFQRAALL